MSTRTFYATTITIVVLSEEPLGADLEEILDDEGTNIVHIDSVQTRMDGPSMALTLRSKNLDPSHFRLTKDGDDLDVDDD